MKAFPPFNLREYALLADGERAALVGPRGEVAWLCAPRWESEPVFAGLIGGTGVYAATPLGRFVPGGYYEDGGLIRRSGWVTRDGEVEWREALALPADPHRLVLLRRLTAADGPARPRLVLEPGTGFGQGRPGVAHRFGDGWTVRSDRLWLRWTGAGCARPGPGGRPMAEVVLAPGERLDLVPEVSDPSCCPRCAAP
ncbi:trehalase-like domain-containing protein [Kitasatospora sp. NPDC057904]|uniref:trehalase-like domain-containing protein n=1 Tax=unclassified Kitasatospora TaxID=2633591 RepID=UPI0036DA22C4